MKRITRTQSETSQVQGGVLLTVRNTHKPEVIELAGRFEKLGFELYGTSGTASLLNHNMIATNFSYRVKDGKEPNVLSLLESGVIDYVVSTSEAERDPALDEVKIRRKSVERGVACLTSIDTAHALADCLESGMTVDDLEMVDITKI